MSLVARELERKGIATASISIVREVSERLPPPRALYLKFPYGHPLGEPGRIPQQRQILLDALAMLEDAQRGEIREPGYRWRRTRYPGEE